MNAAIALLIVNSAVAGMFAVSYFMLLLIAPGNRSIAFFGVSYLIGMLTPISELAVHWSGHPTPFMILSYMAMLSGFLIMSVALALFEGRRPDWYLILSVAMFGASIRISIWGGPRDYIFYELAYQAPFAMALLICAKVAFLSAKSRPGHYVMGAIFSLIASNFILKAFIASIVGSGPSATAYVKSSYAVFSQASTGILLIAAGLVVLLVVVQSVVHAHAQKSETDYLSGLLNRRGFDRKAADALSVSARSRMPLAVVMIDLDHFKRVNDVYGHEVGDNVLRAFASSLQSKAPRSALVARNGGEEFSVLLPGATLEGARLFAEQLRQDVQYTIRDGLPAFTFSAGVAEYRNSETLSDLMRRADAAAYHAKKSGRNRVELSRSHDNQSNIANVAFLRNSG